jgi:hypothetical protein
MTITSEACLYQVADALQMAIHLVGKGYKAHTPREVKVGPWKFKMDMQVKSDVLTDGVASFFIKVRKDLWLYMVSYDRGGKLKCLVFDAAQAKIANGYLATACGDGNLKLTLTRLLQSSAIVLEFDQSSYVWAASNMKDVMEITQQAA